MHDTLGVQILQSFEQLNDNLLRHFDRRESVLLQPGEERELQIFHDNVSGVIRFVNSVEFYDVFMAGFSHVSELLLEGFFPISVFVCEINRPFKGFYCYLFLILKLDGFVDGGCYSPPQDFLSLVAVVKTELENESLLQNG